MPHGGRRLVICIQLAGLHSSFVLDVNHVMQKEHIPLYRVLPEYVVTYVVKQLVKQMESGQ